MLRQRYFIVLYGYRLVRGPGHIHSYFFIDEMYLDYDDTKVQPCSCLHSSSIAPPTQDPHVCHASHMTTLCPPSCHQAKKARAANGQEATVVDFDARGKKWGQLAAVCTGGFCAQFVYPCNYRSTTRDLFEWWLIHFLMPILPPGAIVIMDRAKFHDPKRTASLLRLVGGGLLMLGPYDSPSNAIEYMHHVEKCYLRRDVSFSRSCPDVALYLAGSMITPVMATNTIRHVIGF